MGFPKVSTSTLSNTTRSYGTTLRFDASVSKQLDAYARLFCKAERTTYAAAERAARADKDISKAQRKARIVEQFGLTSRQANAILVNVDAKRSSILALYDVRLVDLTDRLAKKNRQLKTVKDLLAEHKAGKKLRLSSKRHKQALLQVFRYTTQIDKLTAAIARLKVDMSKGRTHMTFGSKKLLRDRFVPEAGSTNGPRTAAPDEKALARWKAEWDLARNGQFLVLGSKDENGGCQGCVATRGADGTYSLRLRMPDPAGGGYLVLEGLRFPYGGDRLDYALAQQTLRAQSQQDLKAKALQKRAAELLANPLAAGEKAPAVKISQKDVDGGVALSWRFQRCADGAWRVMFSTDVAVPERVTHSVLGAVGVDINAGFITVAETDRFGNILSSRKVVVPETGMSADQRAAARGEAVKDVIAQCVRTAKPLVLEKLDFTAKKRDLRMRSPEAKRKLSSLSYRALHDLFSARALDGGVEVLTINPAYTSTQGLVRYAHTRGWSVHQAAAGVIARRGQGLSEKAPVSGMRSMPVAGTTLEWPVPEEIGQNKVSRRWPVVHRQVQRTIASYYQRRRGGAEPARTKLGRQGKGVVAGGTPAPNRTSRTAAS